VDDDGTDGSLREIVRCCTCGLIYFVDGPRDWAGMQRGDN